MQVSNGMDTDRLLSAYVNDRDPAAFEQLVRRYQPLVTSVCRRYLANEHDVEDAAQQVFAALSDHAGTIHSNVGGWLHGCAVNTTKAMIRADATRRRHERSFAASNHKNQSPPDQSETKRHIDECLAELNPDDREVIIQHFMMGRTQASIAGDLSISQQAVQKHVAKASESLRALLRQRGLGLPAAAIATSLLDMAVSASPMQGLVAPVSTYGSAAAYMAGISITTKVLALAACLAFTSILGSFIISHANTTTPPLPAQGSKQWFRVTLTPTPSSVPLLRASAVAERDGANQPASEVIDGRFVGSLIAEVEVEFTSASPVITQSSILSGRFDTEFDDDAIREIEFMAQEDIDTARHTYPNTNRIFPRMPIRPSRGPIPILDGKLVLKDEDQRFKLLGALQMPCITLIEVPSNGPEQAYDVVISLDYPQVVCDQPDRPSLWLEGPGLQIADRITVSR